MRCRRYPCCRGSQRFFWNFHHTVAACAHASGVGFSLIPASFSVAFAMPARSPANGTARRFSEHLHGGAGLMEQVQLFGGDADEDAAAAVLGRSRVIRWRNSRFSSSLMMSVARETSRLAISSVGLESIVTCTGISADAAHRGRAAAECRDRRTGP